MVRISGTSYARVFFIHILQPSCLWHMPQAARLLALAECKCQQAKLASSSPALAMGRSPIASAGAFAPAFPRGNKGKCEAFSPLIPRGNKGRMPLISPGNEGKMRSIFPYKSPVKWCKKQNCWLGEVYLTQSTIFFTRPAGQCGLRPHWPAGLLSFRYVQPAQQGASLLVVPAACTCKVQATGNEVPCRERLRLSSFVKRSKGSN